MIIRRATIADTEAIFRCLTAAFAPYRTRYTPAAYDDTVRPPEELKRRFETMTLFVAVAESGEIVGTIASSVALPGEGHLRGMAVIPEWQGRGVAAALIEAAESELRQQGCTRVTLDTTDPLQRASRFYEKCGYRRSGRISDFFGMPLNEYIKTLTPAPR